MKEWQKVLYLHQPYPDNYVEPAKFLDGLRKNGRLKIHKIWIYAVIIYHGIVLSVQLFMQYLLAPTAGLNLCGPQAVLSKNSPGNVRSLRDCFCRENRLIPFAVCVCLCAFTGLSKKAGSVLLLC